VIHKKEIKIALQFPYNQNLINEIRKIKESHWSYTQKAWLLPDSKEKLVELFSMMNGKAKIDIHKLNEPPPELPKKKPSETLSALPTKSLEKVEKFKSWMRSRRYSENTISTYTEALIVFFRFYSEKRLEDICNEDLIRFNNEYILKNGLSASYQNQMVNGVKLFFRIIEETKLEVDLIHRPKTQKILPNVLSKVEMKKILESSYNLKHRSMLSLIYSCGLRCGELIRLKKLDIDSERRLVIIRQSKGRKDRVVPLSEKILHLLREYYKIFKPENYLFEGIKKGEPYSDRSLQQVLKQCLVKAEIKKPVTLHWLRHSYATHLLESGTDLRYIQELLGHGSSRTTEIYTHVSTKNIQQIRSPFDDL
jgi:integrase/recombinase XerD